MSDEQFFEHNGKQYDRVTTVLGFHKPQGLIDWQYRLGKREANKIMREKAKIGTNADEWIKQSVLGGGLPALTSEEAKRCIRAYGKWVSDHSPELSVGTRLFYDEWGVCGEPDLFWGDRVIDIKCTTRIQKKHRVQAGTYATMAGLKDTAILRLDAGAEDYEYQCWDNDADYMADIFVSHLNIYRFYKED